MFTERAFLNGKMDLSEAEAVNDLINAKDELNATSAIHSIKGSVARILAPLEEDLTQIISNIEVNIDYPEYDDVHVLTEEEILPKARQWLNDIQEVIRRAQSATLIKDGIDTVILGRPNVGKSSLVNLIPRFYDATEGEVRINGRNIKEYDIKNLGHGMFR